MLRPGEEGLSVQAPRVPNTNKKAARAGRRRDLRRPGERSDGMGGGPFQKGKEGGGAENSFGPPAAFSLSIDVRVIEVFHLG